jgi:hypothetical protein
MPEPRKISPEDYDDLIFRGALARARLDYHRRFESIANSARTPTTPEQSTAGILSKVPYPPSQQFSQEMAANHYQELYGHPHTTPIDTAAHTTGPFFSQTPKGMMQQHILLRKAVNDRIKAQKMFVPDNTLPPPPAGTPYQPLS